jgi:hypothetical protein
LTAGKYTVWHTLRVSDEPANQPPDESKPAAGEVQATEEQAREKQAREKHGRTGQKEIGGRQGPDPTRFGDWEIKGRCIDF